MEALRLPPLGGAGVTAGATGSGVAAKAVYDQSVSAKHDAVAKLLDASLPVGSARQRPNGEKDKETAYKSNPIDLFRSDMDSCQKQRAAMKPGTLIRLTHRRKAGLGHAWLLVNLIALLVACKDACSQPVWHDAEATPSAGGTFMTAHHEPKPQQAAQAIASLRDALRAGNAQAVTQVTALVTGTQAPEVVQALALHAQERDGRALHDWARALLRAGDTQPLADVLARLVLGGQLQQPAPQRFNTATAPSTSHAPAAPYAPYTPAATLGYWAGVLQAALVSAAPDESARGKLVERLLAYAASLADATPAGRQWRMLNLDSNTARKMSPDTRLSNAMRPLAVNGIRANGEPDVETADESGPFSAFMGAARRVREGLERNAR